MSAPSARPDYDVVVVGASCAGLVAASRVAAAGMRTLVVDSRPSFDMPERTWIVTRRIEQLIDCDLTTSIVHEIGVMELFAAGAHRRVRLERPDLVVERSLLRGILAAEAQVAGAEIELHRRVQRLEQGPIGFVLDMNGNGNGMARRTARHVIGADGVKSIVAEAMHAGPQNTVPIIQARIALPGGYDPDVTRVWFDRSRTRFFYWLIPESPTTGVVGLVAERPDEARQLLDGFAAEQGVVLEEYQGAMIPLHRPLRRIEWRSNGGRVLLVGDAAAHVKVTTVGGVVSGIWGATAAARALVHDTSYRRELEPLYRELYLHDFVRWVMDRFHDGHYDRLLDLLDSKLDELLGRHDRDSYASRAWALTRAQPKLVLLALDALAHPRRFGARFSAALEREAKRGLDELHGAEVGAVN